MPLKRKSENADATAAPAAPSAASTPVAASASDVLKTLKSGTQEERWAAARAAATLDGGAQILAEALTTESDPQVREAMFTSLTRIRSAESVQALMQLVKADSAHLRTGALDALRAMSEAVREYLPALLSDADVDVRILSCELARSLPSEVATPLLCKTLANEQEPNVCAAAIDVLTEVGNDDALPALAECAQRFAATPFMAFAVQAATERILSQAATTRQLKTDHG